MSTTPTLDGVRFYGTGGVECETFINTIRSYARSMEKGSDQFWIAQEASTCFFEDALRWHATLEDEVQDNWRLLQRALLKDTPHQKIVHRATRQGTMTPTPAVCIPTEAISAALPTDHPPCAIISNIAVGIFHTQDVHGRSRRQLHTSKKIAFSRPFVTPPTLVRGLSTLDIDNNAHARVTAWITNVKETSFTANIDTWSNTTLHAAGFNWLGLPPEAVGFDCGEFSTDEDHPRSQPKAETFHRVTFKRPYHTPPKVICFLSELDIDCGYYSRVTTYASDIDTRGFTLHINTWDNTTLFAATSGWVAYSRDRSDIFSGTANMNDAHSVDSPLKNHKMVDFQGVTFSETPAVFIAFNSIDVGNEANLRLHCYANQITTKGFTWHIDSWYDTKVYNAGISYLCGV